MTHCTCTPDTFGYDCMIYSPQSAPATAGNNRRVHLIRESHTGPNGYNVTLCGTKTPRRPQTTQEKLPKCRRCF